MKPKFSEVGFATFVKALQEFTLVAVLLLFEGAETITGVDVASSNRSDLVKNVSTPDVSLLDVVKSFVAGSSEHVNLAAVTDLVVLSPLVGKVYLSLLRVSISAIACPVDNEGHVSAPLAE